MIDWIAERIADAVVRRLRRRKYVMMTCKISLEKRARYTKWMAVTDDEGVLHIGEEISRFTAKFGVHPTIISIVEVSEGDYRRVVSELIPRE